MSDSKNKGNRQKGRYTLRDNLTGEEINLDRMEPTYGKPAIDLSGEIGTEDGPKKGGLRTVSNVEVHDPAFKSTSSCESDITYIDGEAGILLHRGYNIKELAKESSFMETAYLLRNGELPELEALDEFEKEMRARMLLPDHVMDVIKSFPRDTAPMDMLAAAVASVAAGSDDERPEDIIGQLPSIVAQIIRHQQGKNKFFGPSPVMSFTENFVRMAFADDDGESAHISATLVEAMDKLLILHADHEQNASTSVVRGARSAGSKMAASVAAGVTTLAGPLHGGANQRVLEQLEEIASGDPELSIDEKIEKFIEKAKDPNDDFRLMGFGHRVYKNRDPRATVLKEFVDNLLDDLGKDDPRLEIARKLEAAALNDPYFQQRKLFPNVDFYSGIAMAAMDMDPKLFTLIFAAGRVAGWVAQAEELDQSKQPIARPRQQYNGYAERPYPKHKP